MPPRRRQLFPFVQQLAQLGFVEESASYVTRMPNMFTDQPDWPQLALLLGDGFRRKGRQRLARNYYEQALTIAESQGNSVLASEARAKLDGK